MRKRVIRDHFVDAHEAYLNGVLNRAECRLVAKAVEEVLVRLGESGVNSKADIGEPPPTEFSFMSS